MIVFTTTVQTICMLMMIYIMFQVIFSWNVVSFAYSILVQKLPHVGIHISIWVGCEHCHCILITVVELNWSYNCTEWNMRYRKKLVKNNFRRSFLDNVYSTSDISSKIEDATLEITDNPIEVDLKTFQNNSSSTASITSYDSLLYPETSTRQNLLNILPPKMQ